MLGAPIRFPLNLSGAPIAFSIWESSNLRDYVSSLGGGPLKQTNNIQFGEAVTSRHWSKMLRSSGELGIRCPGPPRCLAYTLS